MWRRRSGGGGSRVEVGVSESGGRAPHGVGGHDAYRGGPVLPALVRRDVVRVARRHRGGAQGRGSPGGSLLLRPDRQERLAGPEGPPVRGVGEPWLGQRRRALNAWRPGWRAPPLTSGLVGERI